MFEPPSADAILAARRSLAAADPALAAVEAVTPPFAWRMGLGGFPGLLKMIVQQQVSLASAAAIWARVEAGLPEMTPEIVADRDEAYLRTLGLSQPKARYARAIAEAHLSGACDFDALRALSDEEAIAALTAIKGVGRWTAEVFLMFTQGRLDLFPGGDVALQEAMRWVDRAETRPTEKQAYARAELWRPYRGVAAHLLWACYGAVKRREIAPF
ncbi:DNA-3-methyladenine glycosylase 2 family protein [Caulobacter vibrioides]|uniref:DNA-3-methyladenine glycosylase family protein n=1 Tax=Caulobacter vibrioides TaxID=155892 RepID=UPI000BB4B428|nr:DNA-3-methyladenine glycosylase [Caulobacter vibrioides]ATC25153.1 DNA-3-methyladenine glycosylase 2 family protein [Caulobacter vibrioides]AZH13303.1 DNA-3-methyladenine glycosylase 2 family protein [Caulobacter vibrioides]PLR08915.1 DNA-3-methyladenine glycosylase 2 family protein [Caulobacter vibrioides]